MLLLSTSDFVPALLFMVLVLGRGSAAAHGDAWYTHAAGLLGLNMTPPPI